MSDLAKLNRLRVNAGKPELKSWKASKEKLEEAIKSLEAAGYVDVLPGANLNIEPKAEDPELIKAREEPKKDDKAPAADKADPEVKKQKPQLARGLETEGMARQSRLAVQMQRERERAEEKAARKDAKEAEKSAKKEDKPKKAKDEKLPKGAVDPKKDPEKAKRQQQHIDDKKKARAEKPKAEKNANEITVAEIARELSIDPKVARAKLRRHEAKIEGFHTKGQDRWTFPIKYKAELVKILK